MEEARGDQMTNRGLRGTTVLLFVRILYLRNKIRKSRHNVRGDSEEKDRGRKEFTRRRRK